ncbi:siderophore ABC transporter substrate-binding protein [Bacillus sp. REN10]|uniref:siderophore ABC transporter substrate-binding protein n=1 Tax=Bacillus sp. REN10 TaxID=2782541 RepID=UPI00193B924C|nr:siderophore ABC transporter substrate-binding protein [Bacillus sp. REN10]
MWKKLSLLLMTMLFVVVAAACSSGAKEEEKAKEETETMKVTHELGETDVPKNPKNVAVFDYGTLSTLDTLGIEVGGLPKDPVPGYLSKYEDEKYENLGGLKEPDFEKIHAMKPDLIIISGRQADMYDQFAEIAPTIYLGVDESDYINSFKKNTEMIGQIFGKEDEVKSELAKIDKDIQAVKDQATKSGKTGLIVLASEGEISAYGPGSRFGIIHDVLGVKPVDPNIKVDNHGDKISFEYIVEKDPDYLFLIDRGAVIGGKASAEQVVANDLMKNTKAVKNDNVVYLDGNYWYLSGGGLGSVSAMVKEVAEGLK